MNTTVESIRKIMMTLIGLAVILLTLTTTVPAQSSEVDPQLLERFNLVTEDGQILVEVSLKNLLLLALERATTMDILAINQQIAQESYAAAKEIFNPRLSTSYGMQRNISVTGTNMSGNVISPFSGSSSPFLTLQAMDVTALSTTWSKKSSAGIVYSLGYQKTISQTHTGRYDEEGKPFDGWDEHDDPLFSDTIAASVSIPLFQDWGDINKFPEYKSLIGVEITEYESQKTVSDLLEMVAGIYWDLVGVEDNIATLQASEELSKQFVADTKTKMMLGVLDPIEVKQGESQLLVVQQNLLTEHFAKKQIEDQIKVALNLQDLPYGYRPIEEMRQREFQMSFEELLKLVYENNQDLSMLHSQVKLNHIQLKEAKNKARTDLDFSLTYQLNGYGKDTANATSSVSDTNMQDYQLGLTWNVPLFDKQTPQLIRQRTLENARLSRQIEGLQAQLKVSLQSILRSLKIAEQGIKLATTSVELAKDLLEKETEKFNLGNNTSFRVAQVQQDLTDARKNVTLSKVNYEKSYLKLLVITGKIFGEYELPVSFANQALPPL